MSPDTLFPMLVLAVGWAIAASWRAQHESRRADGLADSLEKANRWSTAETNRADAEAIENATLEKKLRVARRDAEQRERLLDRLRTQIARLVQNGDEREDTVLDLMEENATLKAELDAKGESVATQVAAPPDPNPDPVWLQLLQQGRAGEAAREAVRGMGIGQREGRN